MSYTYLLGNRLPSQREAPLPENGSIDELLKENTQSTHHLFQTQILTNTQPSALTIAEQALLTDEPLPALDYKTLYSLIRLVTPHLSDHDKKRYDYLVQARKFYYHGHAKFQEAFRTLQDSKVYGDMLTRQFNETAAKFNALAERVEGDATGSATAKSKLSAELQRIDTARRKNNEELRQLLKDAGEKAKKRDQATTWLSSLKWKFQNTEIPPLVRYAHELHDHLKGKTGKLSSVDSQRGQDAPEKAYQLIYSAVNPPTLGPMQPIAHLTSQSAKHNVGNASVGAQAGKGVTGAKRMTVVQKDGEGSGAANPRVGVAPMF